MSDLGRCEKSRYPSNIRIMRVDRCREKCLSPERRNLQFIYSFILFYSIFNVSFHEDANHLIKEIWSALENQEFILLFVRIYVHWAVICLQIFIVCVYVCKILFFLKKGIRYQFEFSHLCNILLKKNHFILLYIS